LTTNRINTFDPAFQSRIHLALKYNRLDAAAREQLWRLFLARTVAAGADSGGFDAAAWPLREIAADFDVNGRQIKNTVRTAHALALAEGAEFAAGHLRDVLETVEEFQADFNRGRESDSGSAGLATPRSTTLDLGLADLSADRLP
jgi:hypothetical protein